MSYRVRRHETANHDAAEVMHIPDHGFAHRVATVTNDGTLRYRHPLAFDRNPIGAFAKIIFGAMAVGDVAAGHAVRCDDTLEPVANVSGTFSYCPLSNARAACDNAVRQAGKAICANLRMLFSSALLSQHVGRRPAAGHESRDSAAI